MSPRCPRLPAWRSEMSIREPRSPERPDELYARSARLLEAWAADFPAPTPRSAEPAHDVPPPSAASGDPNDLVEPPSGLSEVRDSTRSGSDHPVERATEVSYSRAISSGCRAWRSTRTWTTKLYTTEGPRVGTLSASGSTSGSYFAMGCPTGQEWNPESPSWYPCGMDPASTEKESSDAVQQLSGDWAFAPEAFRQCPPFLHGDSCRGYHPLGRVPASGDEFRVWFRNARRGGG